MGMLQPLLGPTPGSRGERVTAAKAGEEGVRAGASVGERAGLGEASGRELGCRGCGGEKGRAGLVWPHLVTHGCGPTSPPQQLGGGRR